MKKTTTRRQVAMVMDLNKCLGCHTCTVACKKLWNRDTGAGHAYWNNVETQPGQGYPRRWEESGGRDASGAVERGELPSLEDDYGRAWSFNHRDVVSSNSKEGGTWLTPDGDPKWGPN
jgi:aldehyde:ferredoxin oxidoreductase